MGGFWSALKRAFGGSGYTYLSAVDDGPRMRSGPATEAPGVDDAVHVTLADLTKKYTELYDAMNLKRGDFTRLFSDVMLSAQRMGFADVAARSTAMQDPRVVTLKYELECMAAQAGPLAESIAHLRKTAIGMTLVSSRQHMLHLEDQILKSAGANRVVHASNDIAAIAHSNNAIHEQVRDSAVTLASGVGATESATEVHASLQRDFIAAFAAWPGERDVTPSVRPTDRDAVHGYEPSSVARGTALRAPPPYAVHESTGHGYGHGLAAPVVETPQTHNAPPAASVARFDERPNGVVVLDLM